MSWDCYLSLGANLGNRGETLRRALRMLNLLPDTKLVASSSFYTTLPWGKTDQPLFLNAAAHVRTEMEPIYFLLACQDIEKKLGRERHEHWGARTCDIDLVYAPEVRSDTEALQLPHPFLTKRAFVLIPLQEIAPKLRIRQYAGKQSEEKADPEPKPINLLVQKRLRELLEIDGTEYPLLFAASRKRFIGDVLGLPKDQRDEATGAAGVIAILNGACMLRVHDVRTQARMAALTDAILETRD